MRLHAPYEGSFGGLFGESLAREGFAGMHTPNPDSKPDTDRPGPEAPTPATPPDMNPVVPQQDPPPGRGADGEPPPIIA